MLAGKARYFQCDEDYDSFAYYLACEVYFRMMDPEKRKIKSVLNYMKAIMKFRRLMWLRKNYKEIIDPVYIEKFNEDQFKEEIIYELNQRNNYITRVYVQQQLQQAARILSECIPPVYKDQANNIYLSALITLIRRYKVKFVNDKRYTSTDKLITRYQQSTLNDSIVLWHLPIDYEEVVRLVINKFNKYMSDEVIGTASVNDITDDEYSSMIVDVMEEQGDLE